MESFTGAPLVGSKHAGIMAWVVSGDELEVGME